MTDWAVMSSRHSPNCVYHIEQNTEVAKCSAKPSFKLVLCIQNQLLSLFKLILFMHTWVLLLVCLYTTWVHVPVEAISLNDVCAGSQVFFNCSKCHLASSNFWGIKSPCHLPFVQVIIVSQNCILNDNSMFCFCLRQDIFFQASPELATSQLLPA